MTDPFQITLKAELPLLEKVWEFIAASCAGRGLPEETVSDLHLAVDEACSNIIAHGYAGKPAGEIKLSLHFEADRIQVEIIDWGRGFDPAEIPEPDIDARAEAREPGGLGWFLIHQVMDRVTYSRSDGANRLSFSRKLGS